jgi:hypothetical protein
MTECWEHRLSLSRLAGARTLKKLKRRNPVGRRFIRRVKAAILVLALGGAAVGQTLNEKVIQSLLDAANGQPTCDLRSGDLPHCVPGPIRRVLGGEDWRLIQNFTPDGIEAACLGGVPDACRLSQLAQDALTKGAVAQKCASKRDCKVAQKEANKAAMASVEANNAVVIRPDGCCGRAATPAEMAPVLTTGQQVVAAATAIAATIYLARVCQQVRRKPLIFLNSNEMELIKACSANGF